MKPSRRDVLCGMCAVTVACTGDSPSSTATPVPSITPDTGRPGPSVPWSPCVVPGTAAEGWVRVGFDEYPELAELLGHAYLQLAGRQIVIAHVEPDCFVALERPCTHEGVLIEYRDERNGFVCPRHGAIYAWDGRVLSGPPPRDTPSHPCGVRDDAVWVQIA